MGGKGVNFETGATGAQGPQGPQGLKGDKGDTGAAGATGAQGLKGDKGDTGATGAQGSQGLKGDKGDKGDTGAAGSQGPTGLTGLTGPQGSQGATGPQGPKGDPGVADYRVLVYPVTVPGLNSWNAYRYCVPGMKVLGGGIDVLGDPAPWDVGHPVIHTSAPTADGNGWHTIVSNPNLGEWTYEIRIICARPGS